MDLVEIVNARRGQRRFVGYDHDKKPVNVVSGQRARVNCPEDFVTLASARKWAEARGQRAGMICGRDILVLDFDGVISDGVLDPWVAGAVEAIGGDVEISVSGNGLHLYLEMTPQLRRLVPRKRRLTEEVPIQALDLLTGNCGVILGTPWRSAIRSPEGQAAAAAAFLAPLLGSPRRRRVASRGPRAAAERPKARSRPTPHRIDARRRRTGEVHADGNLTEAAAARGQLRAYFAYLRIKAEDPEGTGRMPIAGVSRLFEKLLAKNRKHSGKVARRLLDQVVEADFAWIETDGAGKRWLRLRSPEAIAGPLGVELGRRYPVPIDGCLSRAPKSVAYLGRISRRDGKPTTRASRREIGGVSPNTQRKAERRAGVRVERNFVLGSPAQPRRRQWLDDGREVRQIGNTTTVRGFRDRKEGLGTRMATSDPADPRRVFFRPDIGDDLPEGRPALVEIGTARRKGETVRLWKQVR